MATMYIERQRKRRKCKLDAYYYYLTVQNGRQKKRTYIPLRKVLAVMAMLENRKLKEKYVKSPEKVVDRHGGESFYPVSLKHIIKSAGYNIQGSRLRICWKRFLTKAAASIRFTMLEPLCRDEVESPENLLCLNRKAYSLMKRRNRYAVKTSYNDCMAELCPESAGQIKELR